MVRSSELIGQVVQMNGVDVPADRDFSSDVLVVPHRERRVTEVGRPLDCRELVVQMAHAIEKGDAETPGQTFLPFDIFTAENI